MNRFDNMLTFITVVEAESISRAAERLNLAKSAVSRRLKELESHLGTELFHRTTRQLNLTDVGAHYYKNCVRILDDVKESEAQASFAHDNLQGKLRVALPASFGLLHIGSALNEFVKEHPNIKLDLDFNDREVDLIQEGYDVAIRIAQLQDSSLMARKIAPIHTVLCASPDYIRQQGSPKIPEDLLKHSCLLYSLMANFNYWHLTNLQGQQIKVKVQPFIQASAGEYLRDAAVSGLGIAMLPTFIAHKELQKGNLVKVLDDYNLPEINAYAIYPQTKHLSQRVRVFIDFLVARFQGVPYWDVSSEYSRLT